MGDVINLLKPEVSSSFTVVGPALLALRPCLLRPTLEVACYCLWQSQGHGCNVSAQTQTVWQGQRSITLQGRSTMGRQTSVATYPHAFFVAYQRHLMGWRLQGLQPRLRSCKIEGPNTRPFCVVLAVASSVLGPQTMPKGRQTFTANKTRRLLEDTFEAMHNWLSGGANLPQFIWRC